MGSINRFRGATLRFRLATTAGNTIKKIMGVTLLLLFILPAYLLAQNEGLQFERIGREQGLTASSVLSIMQDHQGFMWFGTTDGLFRFDGYGMTVYKHGPSDSTSLGNNYIWTLLEDADGTIWVGTSSGGLNRFVRENEQFIRYRHDPKNPNTISSDVVLSLCQDSNGALWADTFQGLNKIDPERREITRFEHNPEDSASLSPYWIFSVFEDDEGSLWLGTEGGLSRLDVQTGKFEHFVDYFRDPARMGVNRTTAAMIDPAGTVWMGSFEGLHRFDRITRRFSPFYSGVGITSLMQERSGILWIGTATHLLRFDPKTNQKDKFFHQANNPYSLSNNRIQCVYQDRTGALWFGTENGVNRLDREQQPFRHLVHNPEDTNSLSSNRIADIHAGRSGAIWVANWGNQGIAIDKIDGETKQVFRNLPGLQREDLKPGKGIYHLFEDRSGKLWVSMDGLGRYDPKHGQFTLFLHDSNDPHSLIVNDLECTYEDRTGRLWVATYHYGPTDASKFDRNQRRFTHINLVPENQASFSPKNGIASISEGQSGRLWFATKGDGIFLLNPGSNEFIRMTHDPGNPNSLSHNWVKIVHEDRQGTLWAAPWMSGLTKYDPETGQFTVYTEADGLPGSDITTMVEDDRGHLWLTTQYALSRFDPRTETFKNFDRDDGLINDGFQSWHASAKSQTGELFFGDRNGIDYVHPDSIRDNPHIPPVVFTKFVRYNSSEASGQAIVEKGVSEKRRFDLTHEDHTLTFEFAALNYRAPHKNQYAYKLEGFHDDWIHLGNKHEVTLTNLDPGEYTLRVKGSNNDGVWNEAGASLVINISPPWWQTGWAYAVYVILFGLALYGLRRFELRRTQLKNELERKDFEAQKLQEVDRMKSRFFADISHEFRTPLTLMLGPVEKILPAIENKERREDLRVMQRNARRLQRLVEQLLDLSRIEARRMPLRAQQADIVPKIKEWAASFVSLAESKNISLNLHFPEQPIIAYFDAEKLEKIVYNLLSNAFKFTPEGGTVIVDLGFGNADFDAKQQEAPAIRNPQSEIDENRTFIQITVKDTGIGIAKDHLPHIFDRFYRASEALTGEQGGTGIGLALAKEFVELHHGKIRVESEPGKGSTFTVLLPLGRDHLSDDEIVDSVSSDQYPVISDQDSVSSNEQPATSIQQHASSDKYPATSTERPLVLIVEDNDDMRRYLRNSLNPDFEIVEAENGEAGFQVACKKTPDLIVSDVMMPVMDGFALCEKLKTDQRTSHIPVILLTARAGQEDKLEGLEIGADDYLTKPFDARELQVRVKNLIAQRQRLRERFSREITVQPKDITVTSIDEKFLQQALDTVEENISDSDFQIDQFCRAIGMSRSTLNRKLRALTGLSTNVFIRTLRLKRAAQLLEKKSATIVEIAYEVGFNNPSYFAECFREQFGKSPSEWGKNG